MSDAKPAPVPKPSPESPPRMWRTEAVPPGKRRRTVLLGVILGLTLVTGVGLGLLYWLAPPPTPSVLPIAVTANPDGSPSAWHEQDRAALSTDELLGRPLDDWSANPHRDQIRLRFKALAKAPRYRPVVAYLAAPAAVDAAGGVFLLPADRVGDHPRNRLTLAELLAAFKDCPAGHRLLVLDLTPPPEDALFAPLPAELSAAVFRALEAVPDDGRLCLVSCGPGQTPQVAPELGRTAFGHFLELGLHGAADGWAGEYADGRVTVVELAGFTRFKVNEWTTATRGAAQTPVLVGGGHDFPLRGVGTPPAVEDREPRVFEYPEWLKAAWLRSEKLRPSPWAFRKSRAALLGAEHDLLAGANPADAQRELESRLTAAENLAAALTAGPSPDPVPTLAALFPGHVHPEQPLLIELRAAVRAFDARPLGSSDSPGAGKTGTGSSPVGMPPQPEPPVPPEFEPFKAKPHPQLALAAFLVLTEDPAPTAARVRAIDRLLSLQSPAPKFAETSLVRKLAELSNVAGAWSPERAALALQASRCFEDAAARPEVIAWARPAVDEVYRLKADAEAVLFAPGFAPAAETTRRLHDSESAARQLKEAADRLKAARAAWDSATESLAGATGLVDSGAITFPVAEQLAATTRSLGDSLTVPKPLALDAFAAQTAELERHVAAVRSALAEFARPFQPDALAKVRSRAAVPDAGPAAVAELDALLATPLVPPADRAELWNARAALSRRLADAALRRDANDRRAIQARLTDPPAVNPRAAEPESPANLDVTRRRLRWTTALLRVGGVEESAVATIDAELTRAVPDCAAFAERLRRVWTDDAPARLSSRLIRVMPLTPATAALDTPAKNPDATTARESLRVLWAWHAARFEYETHNPEAGDSAFTVVAARSTRAAAGTAASPYLEVTAAGAPKLTPDRPETDLRVNVRAVGESGRDPIRLRVLSPADGWVMPGAAAAVTPDPLREVPARVALAAGDSPVSFPTARGVLVEAEFAGRTYFRRVPVSVEEISDQLRLLVRTAPGQPPAFAREIRVRPDGVAQPYQFLLSNPTPKERKVVVRLAGLDRTTDVLTIPAGRAIPLAFPGAPAVVVAPPVPPQPGQPAPPLDPGVLVPGDELKLELLDPADREEVRQVIRVPVSVANPADYLRIAEPVFEPATATKPNRLRLTVVPGDLPPGGPVTVRMGLPEDRNPGLQIRDGNLVGPVERGGSPLTLYTENLALPGTAGADVTVIVSADGAERAFTFTASLPTLGETVRLTPEGRPLIRVRAPKVATGTAPLPVTLEVDNAPPGATLELVVGTAKDKDSPVSADLTQQIATAKDVAARLKFDPKGETFLFTGQLRDHRATLPVEQLVGNRVVEARLLNRDGKELDRHRAFITFDGAAPQKVRFLDLPPRAANNKPLAVRATCDAAISGIKEVKFFLGAPMNDAPPASPPPVNGKFDAASGEWRASLPVEGQKGGVVVGVQFTTNAGKSALTTQEVELVDPAELNKPEPGSIAGKVIEGKLVQGNAVVFLYDAKGNALSKTTTKADGTFAFKELVPGSYFLFTEKETTNRQAKQEVAVKSGDPTPVTLELLLK